MSLIFLPTNESHFEGLYRALDEVAREKRYLAFIQAPPREQAFEFFHNIVANDLCQIVALEDDSVVGWCDILPKDGDACAHVGNLGMGLVRTARHRGIGKVLLATAIEGAWQKGFSRIELAVRADNTNAKALYERLGFMVEGTNRRAYCIDGEFCDTYTMALVR